VLKKYFTKYLKNPKGAAREELRRDPQKGGKTVREDFDNVTRYHTALLYGHLKTKSLGGGKAPENRRTTEATVKNSGAILELPERTKAQDGSSMVEKETGD